MKIRPMIAVRDVEASSRWYQRLLECQSGHGGNEYEQLVKDDEMFLQLHAWGADEHPNLSDPDAAPHGYGMLLWFQVDDFVATVNRARSLDAEIIEQPHVNPLARHRECWIRDPDGYIIVLASAAGDVG